jgi:hypothetical protein
MENKKMSVQEILNHGCLVNDLSELVDLKSQISEKKSNEMVERIINIFREYELSFYQSEKVIEKVIEVTTLLNQLSSL